MVIVVIVVKVVKVVKKRDKWLKGVNSERLEAVS